MYPFPSVPAPSTLSVIENHAKISHRPIYYKYGIGGGGVEIRLCVYLVFIFNHSFNNGGIVMWAELSISAPKKNIKMIVKQMLIH